MSKVPRGAWNLLAMVLLTRQRAEEWIGRPLRPERRQAHVAGVHDRLLRVGVHQLGDRGEQGWAVAAGEVDAADRALEEDVAGEDCRLAFDRVGDVARAVARGEDDLDLHPGKLQDLAAADDLVGLVAL